MISRRRESDPTSAALAKATKPRKEQDIKKAIVTYLRAKGYRAWVANTGAFTGEYKGKTRFVRFGEKGMPDIQGWAPARLKIGPPATGLYVAVPLFIEVKRPGKEATDAQRAWLIQAAHDGCIAFVAHSVEEVQARL